MVINVPAVMTGLDRGTAGDDGVELDGGGVIRDGATEVGVRDGAERSGSWAPAELHPANTTTNVSSTGINTIWRHTCL